MAAKITRPVVQIIDGDEQHIRPRFSNGGAGEEKEKSKVTHHGPP
jgi:hypothetical protein